MPLGTLRPELPPELTARGAPRDRTRSRAAHAVARRARRRARGDGEREPLRPARGARTVGDALARAACGLGRDREQAPVRRPTECCDDDPRAAGASAGVRRFGSQARGCWCSRRSRSRTRGGREKRHARTRRMSKRALARHPRPRRQRSLCAGPTTRFRCTRQARTVARTGAVNSSTEIAASSYQPATGTQAIQKGSTEATAFGAGQHSGARESTAFARRPPRAQRVLIIAPFFAGGGTAGHASRLRSIERAHGLHLGIGVGRVIRAGLRTSCVHARVAGRPARESRLRRRRRGHTSRTRRVPTRSRPSSRAGRPPPRQRRGEVAIDTAAAELDECDIAIVAWQVQR